MVEKKKFSVPQPTVGEHAHTVGRAIASYIPGAVELFNSIVIPPLEREREKWMEEVGQSLRQLESEGIDIEALKDNPNFIDTVLHATQIAVRNHQEEKRRALKILVLNSARPDPPDQTFFQTALHLIDTLTPWHFRVLKFLASPKQWEEENARKIPRVVWPNIYQVLGAAFPELEENPDITQQVLIDLSSRGLISIRPQFYGEPTPQDQTYEKLMEKNATIPGVRLLCILGLA